MIIYVVEVETWPSGEPMTTALGYFRNLDTAIMVAVEEAEKRGGYWKLNRYRDNFNLDNQLQFTLTSSDEGEDVAVSVTCHEVRE